MKLKDNGWLRYPSESNLISWKHVHSAYFYQFTNIDQQTVYRARSNNYNSLPYKYHQKCEGLTSHSRARSSLVTLELWFDLLVSARSSYDLVSVWRQTNSWNCYHQQQWTRLSYESRPNIQPKIIFHQPFYCIRTCRV